MWCTDGLNVALQVWDIGGQSIGGRMLDKYIYGSHVSLHHTAVISDCYFRFVRPALFPRVTPREALSAGSKRL